ncbi:amine oxidase, flavin-containing superfamily [Sphaerulina musiva SO2202]|uniref:Amine oxidase, flavin-containing superfamily n=1 Tax=Sphaerulina musiva (strain SO2202) TaxID=692275 RepID=N1QL27_SPHMS|nr:amine oxidase, flavin-containing superfamily [Sphaerulina musiva SO2202]EMF11871.1 amine oxidase, flavin-containing superfamily [Sphaerulina musiva SO2202]
MFSHRLLVALSVATTLAYATPPPSPPLSSVREFCNLTVDVAVIGGGGGGAYAAARLHQQGYKVALIERDGRLGGHVNTYRDPTSGGTFDYGVQIFSNISVVRDFFGHYKIPLVPAGPLGGSTSQTVDFSSGLPITVPQDTAAIGQALMGYGAQVAKYPSLNTFWKIPQPIPEDLLMPFGAFLQKYNLQSLAYIVYSYQQGLANVLAQTTLYLIRFFDLQQVQDIANSAFMVNGLQNNQALYDAVATELGNSVLLNTQATKIVRTDNAVLLDAKSTNTDYQITAKKLLIAIPPTPEKLQFLDLHDDEFSVFSKLNASHYWNSIVLNSGLPPNLTLTNISPAAPLAIPSVPGVYTINMTPFPGVVCPLYGSDHALSDSDVQADILATIKRIRQGMNISVTTEPEFVEFNSHNPFHFTVSPEEILGGFYDRMEALQGQRKTWFTGAAWSKPASSAIWNFTEYQILPGLMEGL